MSAIPRDANSIPRFGWDSLEEVNKIALLVWNPSTLQWEKMTQPMIDATNSNLYLALDGVEALLEDIKDNTYTIVPDGYDYVGQSQNTTQDIWVFKSGGASGTILGTITITYTGTDKSTFQSIARS